MGWDGMGWDGMGWDGILYLNQETRQPQQHSAGFHGGFRSHSHTYCPKKVPLSGGTFNFRIASPPQRVVPWGFVLIHIPIVRKRSPFRAEPFRIASPLQRVVPWGFVLIHIPIVRKRSPFRAEPFRIASPLQRVVSWGFVLISERTIKRCSIFDISL